MNNTEETLDFEQKHKEDLQRLRGFRLLDDDFMSKVFEDKACAEFLLQIILQRHDLKVQSVQISIRTGRHSRMIAFFHGKWTLPAHISIRRIN